MVAPFVPLLFLEVEELPFGCLLAETKFFFVSFGWVGLETFCELTYLFRPFWGFWGKKERVDKVVLVLEMGIASIAAVFTS